MHESKARGAPNGVGSKGPRKGPWQGPGGRVQGAGPRKILGFSGCERSRKALLEVFLSLNQPKSGAENELNDVAHYL